MNDCIYELKLKKRRKKLLIISQIMLLFFILIIWELLAYFKAIDTFLFSSPSRIFNILLSYIETGELWRHVYISLVEVILGIIIGTILGVFIASVLWYSERLSKLLDPFLAVLNALPKTALAPIMIIWAGTGVSGIVVVALSILLNMKLAMLVP